MGWSLEASRSLPQGTLGDVLGQITGFFHREKFRKEFLKALPKLLAGPKGEAREKAGLPAAGPRTQAWLPVLSAMEPEKALEIAWQLRSERGARQGRSREKREEMGLRREEEAGRAERSRLGLEEEKASRESRERQEKVKLEAGEAERSSEAMRKAWEFLMTQSLKSKGLLMREQGLEKRAKMAQGAAVGLERERLGGRLKLLSERAKIPKPPNQAEVNLDAKVRRIASDLGAQSDPNLQNLGQQISQAIQGTRPWDEVLDAVLPTLVKKEGEGLFKPPSYATSSGREALIEASRRAQAPAAGVPGVGPGGEEPVQGPALPPPKRDTAAMANEILTGVSQGIPEAAQLLAQIQQGGAETDARLQADLLLTAEELQELRRLLARRQKLPGEWLRGGQYGPQQDLIHRRRPGAPAPFDEELLRGGR